MVFVYPFAPFLLSSFKCLSACCFHGLYYSKQLTEYVRGSYSLGTDEGCEVTELANKKSRDWAMVTVILATRETEIWTIAVQSQHQQKVQKAPSKRLGTLPRTCYMEARVGGP
jgi:hypothetical protein